MRLRRFFDFEIERALVPFMIVVVSLGLTVIALVLLGREPISWLPPRYQAREILSALLGAQAAIAALTLVVTVFVLQSVDARRDAGERLRDEYVRRSSVWPIFAFSLLGVLFTGVALLAEFFREAPLISAVPGSGNLAILAPLAFLENLAAAFLLFTRAIRLSRPGEWRRFKRQAYEQDVRGAVEAFLGRYERARAHSEDGEVHSIDILPDPGEEKADEAIRALLGDALRAMGEWRQEDFEWALETARTLVETALDELETGLEENGRTQSAPGSHPEWPPMATWGRSLYPFREEVIIRGGSWYGNRLASLDFQLASIGIERRWGDVFTVGLRGYQSNYEIASRVANDQLRGVFRDRAWLHLAHAFDAESADDLPYLQELSRHHAVLLFRAMTGDHLDDFESLREGFGAVLRTIGWRAQIQASAQGDSPTWPEQAQQDGRVAFMQVGGVGMHLAESGDITDPQPYLSLVRSEYPSPQALVPDAVRAIDLHNADPFRWFDLVDSSSVAIEWTGGEPTDYALHFLLLRLLELASDPMPDLNLGRAAGPALAQFEENRERISNHAQFDDGPDIDRRHELVFEALNAAAQLAAAPDDT